jgi:hypothetical protein
VEILKIWGAFIRTLDGRKFCNFFPNLRVFSLSKYSARVLNGGLASQRFELILPDTELEKIKDGDECELTRLLIMTGACTKLRELELSLCDFNNPRQNIYTYMKNIPALKKLTLSSGHFGIQDCEILHSNLPTLEVFELIFVHLDPGELPANITPATSVTEFSISFEQVTNETQLPNWYIYMTKKYTNLTRLGCSDFVMEDIDLDLTTVIYRDGIIPLYKNIGKHLHFFNAKNVPTEVQLFKQMDDIGCRFSRCRLEENNTRRIFTQLAQSNLAKYIVNLEIERTIIDSPSLFQNMTYLTMLSIDADCEPINLTEYPNAFPRGLGDFHVNCTDLEISELPNQAHCMGKLWISCNTLSEELVNFILDFFLEKNQTIDYKNIKHNSAEYLHVMVETLLIIDFANT